MDTIWGGLKDLGGGRWIITSFLPSTIFVALGSLLLFDIMVGWMKIPNLWNAFSDEIKIGVLLAALVLTLLCSLILDLSNLDLLKWANGYYVLPMFGWYFEKRRRYYARKFELLKLQFNDAKRADNNSLINTIGDQIRHFPPNSNNIMPTQVGNAIRAAEETIRTRYGLDPIVTWLPLYLCITDECRELLVTTRASLDCSIRFVWFSLLLTIIFLPLRLICFGWIGALEFGVIMLICLLGARAWSITNARLFADAIRASYNLYRFDLYKTCRFPLPKEGGKVEVEAGKRLSEFLERGEPVFVYVETEG